MGMTEMIERDDPRWTLAMEYEARGLMRPSQFKKRVPRGERKLWRTVRFKWGRKDKRQPKRTDQMVRGYKMRTGG